MCITAESPSSHLQPAEAVNPQGSGDQAPANSPPNTASGLRAKRKELAGLLHALEAEVRKVTCDLDHLDAAIRLFDAETTPATMRRYVVRYRAKNGTVEGSSSPCSERSHGP